MTWERGDAGVEVEMSRVQSWIETTDPELHGRNGDKGMLRQFWEDRSFIKGALWVLVFLGGGDFVIHVLQVVGLVK